MPKLNSYVIFNESPVLLGMSVNSNVHTNSNGVQLEMELQLETPKVADTSKIIDMDGACSEVEPIEITVAVIANIDNMHIRSLDKYGCNDNFAFFAVKEIISKSSCRVVKGACRVGILMRSTAMAKFKRCLNLKDLCGS